MRDHPKAAPLSIWMLLLDLSHYCPASYGSLAIKQSSAYPDLGPTFNPQPAVWEMDEVPCSGAHTKLDIHLKADIGCICAHIYSVKFLHAYTQTKKLGKWPAKVHTRVFQGLPWEQSAATVSLFSNVPVCTGRLAWIHFPVYGWNALKIILKNKTVALVAPRLDSGRIVPTSASWSTCWWITFKTPALKCNQVSKGGGGVCL